jgi:hypothetical protein
VGKVGEDDDEDEYHHLIIEKERNLSENAIKQLRARRNLLLDEEAKKTTELKRKVRLLKEVDYTTDEQDSSVLIPKPMNKGKMFCLVRLGDNFPFPFKIGIDTDWILKGTTRERLETQDMAGDWHRELLEMVPELIRDYLDSMPTQTNPENRKRWLDVFPDPNSREPHLGLEFLETDDFKELMKKSLSDCKFVLCADGETRTPTEVSDMPKKKPGMTDSGYAKFIRDCFDCPILETESLEPSTLRYLKWLGFLTFPKEEDINALSIQGLWEPNSNSSTKNYKHILDILYEITPKDDDDGGQLTGVALGLKVVPTSRDDEWGRLVDPELAFIAIPKGGNTLEAPLRTLLVGKHPEFKEAKELHQSLRVPIKKNEPGYTWKLNAKKTAIDVIEKLKNLKVPNDEDHVLAKYRYALRGKLPFLVTHLHTVGGCKPVGECLIGPPLGHELMEQIAPDQILSKRMVSVPRYTRDRLLKFLESAGAVSLVPTRITNEVPITEATKFAGSKPPTSSRAGSTKNDGLQRGYTTNDWEWPLKLSEIKDQNALSDYLGMPDDRLKRTIESAGRRRNLTYFFITKKTHTTTITAAWITDLKELAWVRCVDGNLRKPIDTSFAHGSQQRDEHADLGEEVIEFYTQCGIAFGEDIPKGLDERLEFWRTTPAGRNQKKFSETLSELANPDNFFADSMDIPEELGAVLWWTKSGGSPLRRFIRNPSSDLGGFVGHWGSIPGDICELLENVGMEPPDSITNEIAREFIEHIRETYDTDIDETTLDNLREANSVILGKDNSDFGNCSFITYDGSWIKASDDSCLIQLTHDENRFEELRGRLLHPRQLPSRKEDLRNLYEPGQQFSLLDNDMELSTIFSAENETEINIRRLMDSLGLDFTVRYAQEHQLSVSFEGEELTTPYLVKDDEGEIKIYLSTDKTQWEFEIASFIVAQSETTSSSDFIEAVRKSLHFSSDNFEIFYNKLSKFGLEMFGPRAVKHGEAEPEEPGDKDEGPTPLSPVEITETSPVFNDEEGKESGKSTSTRKPKKPKKPKKAKPNLRPVSGRKGRPKTDDDTVKMVTEYLRSEGWKPLDDGALLRMKNSQMGFDIQAVKGNVILRIEAKGREAIWGKSNVWISRKQMQHAFKFHGTKHEAQGVEYVAEYRLAVIEESISKPKVRLISFMEYDFDFVFDRSDFPKDEDATSREFEEE